MENEWKMNNLFQENNFQSEFLSNDLKLKEKLASHPPGKKWRCETEEEIALYRGSKIHSRLTLVVVNVNLLHLYSAICIASEALLVNHLCSAPSQGRLRQCRLGFEHDTLRLLLLEPHKGNDILT